MKLIGGPKDGEDIDCQSQRCIFPERHTKKFAYGETVYGTYYREWVYERIGDELHSHHVTEWRWCDWDDDYSGPSRAYAKPGPEYDVWVQNWRKMERERRGRSPAEPISAPTNRLGSAEGRAGD